MKETYGIDLLDHKLQSADRECHYDRLHVLKQMSILTQRSSRINGGARVLTPIFRVSLSPKDIAMHIFTCDSDWTDETALVSFGSFFVEIRLKVFGDIQLCIQLAHSS